MIGVHAIHDVPEVESSVLLKSSYFFICYCMPLNSLSIIMIFLHYLLLVFCLTNFICFFRYLVLQLLLLGMICLFS